MCDNDTIVRWKYQQNMTPEERARRNAAALLNIGDEVALKQLTAPNPDARWVADYYRDQMMRMLNGPTFLSSRVAYQQDDVLPSWRRRLARVRRWTYIKTLGRFREWLHRDCGGDW